MRVCVPLNLLPDWPHLAQAVLLFVSGEHKDPIARVNDLVAVADNGEKYNFYQVRTTIQY